MLEIVHCPGCGLAIDKPWFDSKLKEMQEREERKVDAEIEELFNFNSFLKLKEFPQDKWIKCNTTGIYCSITDCPEYYSNWDGGC